MNLFAHLAQLRAAEREMLELAYWEAVCWRMYGLRVTQVMDEIIVEAP